MTRPDTAADWPRLIFDASCLWADAGMVVALRSWRIMAGGPIAGREIRRMVAEKVESGAELAGALAIGGLDSPESTVRKALKIYGRRVRANRRRLG